MSKFICARCSEVYPTCCRMDPAEAHLCFPLSSAEIRRLEPYAQEWGIAPGTPETTSREFLRTMRYLFPDRQKLVRERFPLNGEHFRLPISPNGTCLFLEKTGCRLPRDARPLYCRLFPIWIRAGEFDLFAGHQCLVSREAPGVEQAMRLFALTPQEAQALYTQLCADWGLTIPASTP